ncbi:MAG: hypothetical protein JXL84_25445 [Deltaproteobacteria bacterium]|nr:hypothetical protein [Deltaproteobacteria bacterium]
MKKSEAILAFSQSDKIKAGLISVAQLLDVIQGLPAGEKKGAERVTGILLTMTAHEVRLAENLLPGEDWKGIESLIERAQVMVASGVAQEGMIPLSRALSLVTNVAQKAMSFLKEEGLL